MLTPTITSPYFLIAFFAVIIILAIVSGIFKGAKTLFVMAGYAFYTVAWLMGLLATFFVGVGLDLVYLSQNLRGALLFAVLLAPYFYSAWRKYRLKRSLGFDSVYSPE